MSEETTPENPGIEIIPITVGMHLGEHYEPEGTTVEVDLGAEPGIIIRPCEDDGVDVVFDVILSRTSPAVAVAMISAVRSLLIDEMNRDDSVEKLLKDIFEEAEKTEESTENTGEL